MLIFLKLGGSLITDKTRPFTVRPERLDDLAQQIAAALKEDASLRLVLGHGSGSFGHIPASRHDTRQGVTSPEDWHGFAEVWYRASTLNRFVVEALHDASLPVVAISPVAAVTAQNGKTFIWDTYQLQSALSNGLLPVIHGDVVFDDVRGGTILSTEDLFSHLARLLHPGRILLAGLEAGVWEDFPKRRKLLTKITPATFSGKTWRLGSSVGTDVTGGMQSKVADMLTLVDQMADLEILIFSGEEKDAVRRALLGATLGTCLHR